MPPKTVSQLIETSKTVWKPAKYPGVEYVALHADPAERTGSFLYKMAPGATFPRHRHAAGEELLLLRGDLTVGDRVLKGGDFLYSPAGSIHAPQTTAGCMFFSTAPKGIQVIPTSPKGELDETSTPDEAALVDEPNDFETIPDLER